MASINGSSTNSAITRAPSASEGGNNHQEYDKDREAILFKGVCRSLLEVCIKYNIPVSLPCVCIPLGIYCGRKAADSWCLYVTKSAIHYLYYGTLNIDQIMWKIPLKDIKSIAVEASRRYNIVVVMEPEAVYLNHG